MSKDKQYQPVRIRKDDWKKMKYIALEEEIKMLDLVSKMIEAYEEKKEREGKKWLVLKKNIKYSNVIYVKYI